MSSKTILLAITGLTPQIVTETLYAIYQQGQLMPAEIHLLATFEGYRRAKLLMISPITRFRPNSPDLERRHEQTIF